MILLHIIFTYFSLWSRETLQDTFTMWVHYFSSFFYNSPHHTHDESDWMSLDFSWSFYDCKWSFVSLSGPVCARAPHQLQLELFDRWSLWKWIFFCVVCIKPHASSCFFSLTVSLQCSGWAHQTFIKSAGSLARTTRNNTTQNEWMNNRGRRMAFSARSILLTLLPSFALRPPVVAHKKKIPVDFSTANNPPDGELLRTFFGKASNGLSSAQGVLLKFFFSMEKLSLSEFLNIF